MVIFTYLCLNINNNNMGEHESYLKYLDLQHLIHNNNSFRPDIVKDIVNKLCYEIDNGNYEGSSHCYSHYITDTHVINEELDVKEVYNIEFEFYIDYYMDSTTVNAHIRTKKDDITIREVKIIKIDVDFIKIALVMDKLLKELYKITYKALHIS